MSDQSPIKYTSFDYQTLKSDFVAYLKTKDTFKDYNFAGSNITTIEEMIAGMGDIFNLYINAMANEPYFRTCDLYESANKNAENIGYNPKGPTSATVKINLTSSYNITQLDDYFILPAWDTKFIASTLSPNGNTLTYLLTETVLNISNAIGNNEFNRDVYLIEGDRISENFTGTGLEYQRFELESSRAIEDYMKVEVKDNTGEYIEWDKIEDMYSSEITSASKVYTVRFNKNQRFEVQFGNGIFGMTPEINSDVRVTFINTWGFNGKIGIGELTSIEQKVKIRDAYTDIEKTEISFVVSQTELSEGGTESETTNDIVNRAPKTYKAQKRLTSDDDHKTLLLNNFGSFIYDVKTLNSNEYWSMPNHTLTPETSGRFYNNVYLYILPKYTDSLSGLLLEDVIIFLERYKISTTNYIFESFDFINIDANITFKKLEGSILTSGFISSSIDLSIKDYFKRANRKIGEEIKYSGLLKRLQELSGVSSINVTLSADHNLTSGWSYDNIELDYFQFPKLKSVNIVYNGTGA